MIFIAFSNCNIIILQEKYIFIIKVVVFSDILENFNLMGFG